MLSKKSFGGIYEDFLKLPMRSIRGDVRDHIASQKNDHGRSYRHYKASQRRSSPKITSCEIFGVARFSTFSTASAITGSQSVIRSPRQRGRSSSRKCETECSRRLEIDSEFELRRLFNRQVCRFSAP